MLLGTGVADAEATGGGSDGEAVLGGVVPGAALAETELTGGDAFEGAGAGELPDEQAASTARATAGRTARQITRGR